MGISRLSDFQDSPEMCVPHECCSHAPSTLQAQLPLKLWVRCHEVNRLGQEVRFERAEIDSSVPAHFPVDGSIRSNNGKAMRHRFRHGVTEGLGDRGKHKNIGVAILLFDFFLSKRSSEFYPWSYILTSRQADVVRLGEDPTRCLPMRVDSCL